MHSNLHLERIGDQAVNVAKIYQATKDAARDETMRPADRPRWATSSSQMVRTAMDAFGARDLELCLQLPDDGRPGRPAEPQHAPRGR